MNTSRLRPRGSLRFFPLICAMILAFGVYLYFADLGFKYEWQWNRVWRRFLIITARGVEPGPLCKGLFLTLEIVGVSLILSVFGGLFLAALKFSPTRLCKGFAALFIGGARAIPLLFQLFLIYFLLAPLLDMGPLAASILTLSAFEGACFAVIFESAILTRPREQWEAAISLGFSVWSCLYLVILPQAIRAALPSLTNQAISLVKDSSLVSAIAVAELTMRSQALVAETFLAFEVWLFAAFVYLLLNTLIAVPAIIYERTRAWK